MKICYIFSNIHLGETTGQSGMALRMVKKSEEKGCEIYIVSNYENQQNNLDIIDAKKFLIKGPSTFKTYFLNCYKILKYLKKIKPDIIHIQGHLLIPFIYFLNKFAKCRIVCTLSERIDYLNKILRYIIITSIKDIGLCFVLSYWDKESLVQLGISEDRILVTHIGLRDSFLINEREKQKYEYDIFYYGDASKERGFDVLYNLSRRLPNLKFKLLIRWEKEGKEKLKELQKLENVSIDYFRLEELELKQLILRSKLILLPYRWMGVQPPLTLVEAMALGKCVLTSGLPGSKELITDNKNAVLIDPDSPIDETIKKIENLLNNSIMVEKLGKNARNTIFKKYSLSEYDKVFIIYEMIVKNFYEWRMFGNVGGDFVSRKEINILLKLLKPENEENILDVGTGSGRFARAIIKNSNVRVIGLDPDEKILAEGQKLKKIYLSDYQQKKYLTVFGNGQNIPFNDNTFDKVFCFRVLKYYDDPWRGIDELMRVVKPADILVLEIISDKSWESLINPFLLKMRKKRKILHFWEEKMINFNPSQVKNYLSKNRMLVIDEVPLHKVPPYLYSIFDNQYMNYLLDILDKILLKITPKYLFSKSIVLKCRKL